jgi:PWI domain
MMNPHTAQWVQRELTAILMMDAVDFVCSYVMAMISTIGLNTVHGLPDFRGPAADHPVVRELRSTLYRFLQDDTDHFWHELRWVSLLPCMHQSSSLLLALHISVQQLAVASAYISPAAYCSPCIYQSSSLQLLMHQSISLL